MRDLCIGLKDNFVPFYQRVYKDLDPEPITDLTETAIEELVGIIHSVEIGFLEGPYQYKVSAIIVNTATRQILQNGNKRLSLILGYYCAHWFGYSMILLDGTFPQHIKTIVSDVERASHKQKDKIRLSAIEALANEIVDYSVPHTSSEPPDNGWLSKFIKTIKGKI